MLQSRKAGQTQGVRTKGVLPSISFPASSASIGPIQLLGTPYINGYEPIKAHRVQSSVFILSAIRSEPFKLLAKALDVEEALSWGLMTTML
jgi:hypothetical protein